MRRRGGDLLLPRVHFRICPLLKKDCHLLSLAWSGRNDPIGDDHEAIAREQFVTVARKAESPVAH